jgi:phosphoglycolate phosphatase-like HAD superfamily hydrolase
VLVLWDVDHTLIENNGVNKETYALAFQLLTGRQAEYPARTDGRTEPEIMRDMLDRHGIELTPEHIATMPGALESATSAKAADLRQRGHELPGAREALSVLQGTAGIVQSVLSGNTMKNAIAKLSAFGLDSYIDFEVGGYGSDDIVRANLVGVARKRATAKYGTGFDQSTTVLIGDTPRDIQVGRNGGAYVIAVASGSDDMETLRREGADVVFPGLRDTQAVVTAVTARQGGLYKTAGNAVSNGQFLESQEY